MLAALRRAAPLLSALAAACEDKPPPPAPPPTPSAVVSAFGIDAGEAVDPPAPAGDLKLDLERFTNVDQCVAERAKMDPLVGDALSAIGYDTFLRDACRLLEAAKDRRRETCELVDSSALRARCQTWVAQVARTPDACPLQFEGMVTRGRSASCVAVAARDPRLCAGEARTAARATCEALTARDAARCDVLLPAQRGLCQRELARWSGLLSAPLEGLEKIAPARAKLAVHGVNGTAEPLVPEVDLAADYARGVVLVTSAGRARLEVGTLVESEAARIAASPQKRPRIGLAVVVDDKRTTLQKLELELPGDAPLVSPPMACDCTVKVEKPPAKRGDALVLTLEGTLTTSGRSYKIAFELASFARDLVQEAPGSRLLPPLPRGAGAGVDAGATRR